MSDDQLSQDVEDADVNRVDDGDEEGDDELAPTATNVLDLLVTSLVDDADAVRIDATEQRGKVRLEVRVGPDEMGRVIGKRGRTANAIRTVVRAAAARDDVHVDVEFED
jgi:predicted RNA-binding protein YlqC (UPF0109 family)